MEHKITVDVIYQKDFRTKKMGYDPEEVDGFLDDIIAEMESMNKTISTLQAELREARTARPAATGTVPVVKPAAEPASNSGSIQEVLAMAVKLKEDTLGEARAQAKAILEEAEQKAKERLGGLEAEHERLTRQVEEQRRAAASYRERFEALVKAQSEAMDKAGELFE